MKHKLLAILILPLIFIASSAQAAVLSFEDPDFPVSSGAMGYSYGGFYWFNLERIEDTKEAVLTKTNPWPSNSEAYTNPYALSSINNSAKLAYIQLENPEGIFRLGSFHIRSISNTNNVALKGYSSTGELLFETSPFFLDKDYFYFNSANYLYNSQSISEIGINKLEISWEDATRGINLDDFSYPAPEPSTMLMGLAGLTAFIRRKNK